MQVEQLMTKEVLACGPEDSLNCAAQLMWEGDVGAVPVIDAERRVVGIITDRDISMAAYLQGGDLASHKVADTMSQQVYCCAPGDSIESALETMRRRQVRRVPVVNGGQLVGLLSLNDVALATRDGKAARRRGPGPDDVATTLAYISQHRSKPAAMAAE